MTFESNSKILKFEGAFHGTCDYVSFSTIPSQNLNFPNPEPDTQGIPKGVKDTVLVAPYNDADYATQIIRDNKDDLAAVILCPQTLHIPADQEFIDAVRSATKEKSMHRFPYPNQIGIILLKSWIVILNFLKCLLKLR